MLVLAALCILFAADPMVGFTPGSATATLLAETRIPLAQARSIALQAVTGSVLEHRLERAGIRWVYTFEICPVRFERGVHIVQIDALDGSIVTLARKGNRRRSR